MSEQEKWSDNCFASDDDDCGMTRMAFANALQAWSVMQQRPTTVGEAMLAFNCSLDAVLKAVEDHYWMFLEGDDPDLTKRTIFHEGE